MPNTIKKIIRLMAGYFIYGLSIALTVNADLGLAPWGVFHQGMSRQFGITMGTAIQIAGLVIIVLDLLLNERIGWGTVGNVYFIGLFLDLVQQSGWIPVYQALLPRFLMMMVGLFLMSLATYLYLSAQLGSGPRDGLMVALTKRIRVPVGVIRSTIELSALTAGYFMGGSVGWGTLIMSLSTGFFIQTTFSLFKFDVRQIKHHTIDQDIVRLMNKPRQL
jgi:uncharacterized membrane protein YczE